MRKSYYVKKVTEAISNDVAQRAYTVKCISLFVIPLRRVKRQRVVTVFTDRSRVAT
jgi:hypothetical protein